MAGAMELAHHHHLADSPSLQGAKEGDRALEIKLLRILKLHRDPVGVAAEVGAAGRAEGLGEKAGQHS